MGISIFVLPLTTWLRGDFRPSWGGEAGPSRPRRTEEAAGLAREAFDDALETLLGRRSDWNEEGPVQAALTMSVHGFGRPFLRARAWAYRRPLPRLVALEPPQIWIPASFEGLLSVSLPDEDGRELSVVSAPGVAGELDQLLGLLKADPLWEELESLPQGSVLPGLLAEFWDELETTRRLRDLARQGVEERVPVIIEG